MKKTYTLIALAVSLLAAAISCTKEADNKQAATMQKVSFSALSTETKAVFGALDGTSYPTYWSVSDAAPAITVNYNSSFAQASDFTPSTDGTTARFTGDVSDALSSYTFISVTPYAALKSVYAAEKRLNLEVPSAQTPGDGTPDEDAMVLYAVSSEYENLPESVDLTFSHATAYMLISFSNLTLEDGETVQSIDITSDADIAGRMFFFPLDGSVDDNSMVKTISLSTSSVEDVWVAAAPADLSNTEMTFKVLTDKGYYAKSVTFGDGKKLSSGVVAKFTVDMAGITRTDPVAYSLVEDASNLQVGDEILIVANLYDLALSTAQNNNNRGTAGITKTEGYIYSPSDAVAKLTLKDGYVPGEYALYDSAKSGYLYFASGGNFLRTKETVDASASWDIDIQQIEAEARGSGNVAYIQEKTDGRYIRCNYGSNIFSAYVASSSTSFVQVYRKEQEVEASFNVTVPGGTSVGASTTSLPVYVFGNVAWTAAVSGEGASLDVTSGAGPAILTLAIPANTSTTDTRSYTVTVTTEAAVANTQYEYTITQSVVSTTTGDLSVGDVIWSETFKGATPSGSLTPSTYIEGDAAGLYCWEGTPTYAQSASDIVIFSAVNNGTYVYYTDAERSAHYAEGDKNPENLILRKGGGTWTIGNLAIPSKIKKAMLYYRINSSGATNYIVSTDSGDDVVVLSNHTASDAKYYTFIDGTTSGKKYYENTYVLTFPENPAGTTFSLKFINNNSSANCRVGDIELIVTELYE